jgi:hypothetical protein
MKNLSRHTDRLCELVTSLLIRGMSKLGWLFGLIKHAIWVDSLYFLYLLPLTISQILPLSQPTYDPLHRHVGLIVIFLEDHL